ncbi:hypothetical protein GF312_09470 [Candidatus Poribacteria bacterium]|nr:hypothetical protein [Candidatus Poribacteria bacterium]
MKNRKTALILSLIYCGIGQIYKGEKAKGFTFILIQTSLIAFFIFYLPYPIYLKFVIPGAMVLMWLMGMMDAYIDDGLTTDSDKMLLIIKIVGSIEAIVILFAFVVIILSGYESVGLPNHEGQASEIVMSRVTNEHENVITYMLRSLFHPCGKRNSGRI